MGWSFDFSARGGYGDQIMWAAGGTICAHDVGTFVTNKASGRGTGRGHGGDEISPAELLSDDYRLKVLPFLKLEGDSRLTYDQKMIVLDAVSNNIEKIRQRLRAQATGVTRLPRPAKMKRPRCGRNRCRRPPSSN